jgi:orotate phosphoribosyltransferase
METRSREVIARSQPLISMRITPGHFATRNSHINYYIDLTDIKYKHSMARLAARELAAHYAQIPIDTIICVEGTEVLAAFLAEALSNQDSRSINSGASIFVITPETNISGQLMFRDNIQRMIWDRNVLTIVASATTGATIAHAIDCVAYYNGRNVGICAIFSAIASIGDIPVRSIFNKSDVPGYAIYTPAECPDCRAKKKIDALVNSYGYSKL